jgi:hypothetical protein
VGGPGDVHLVSELVDELVSELVGERTYSLGVGTRGLGTRGGRLSVRRHRDDVQGAYPRRTDHPSIVEHLFEIVNRFGVLNASDLAF